MEGFLLANISANDIIHISTPKDPDEMIMLIITKGKNGKKCSSEFYIASLQPRNLLFLWTYKTIVTLQS